MRYHTHYIIPPAPPRGSKSINHIEIVKLLKVGRRSASDKRPMSSFLSFFVALCLTSIVGDIIVFATVVMAAFLSGKIAVRAMNKCVAGISASVAIICATVAAASFLVAVTTRSIVQIVSYFDDYVFAFIHSFVDYPIGIAKHLNTDWCVYIAQHAMGFIKR